MRYLLTGIVVRMPPQMRPGLTGPRTSYSPRCSRTVIMRAGQEDFEVMKRRLCAGLASTILVASQGLSTVSAIGGFPVLDATPMVLADDDLKAQVGCVLACDGGSAVRHPVSRLLTSFSAVCLVTRPPLCSSRPSSPWILVGQVQTLPPNC